MPAILVSSLICFLVTILPVVPFFSRSPQPTLSSNANSYGVARDKAVARKRMLIRAREARDKEHKLAALRAKVQSQEDAMRHTSFMALQDRILLWNQIWKLEKELKALRTSTGSRKRQVVVEGGINSRSSSSMSRVITGRSSDGSRVSWRAMLSLAVNPSASTSNLDLSESVDDIVDEIAHALHSRGSCSAGDRNQDLSPIMEESNASFSSASSDSDSDDGSDHTIVDSPTLVHAKLPPSPPALCVDDHKIFSPTHVSPNAPTSFFDWIAAKDRLTQHEEPVKEVIFEPAPDARRFSSWHDVLSH